MAQENNTSVSLQLSGIPDDLQPQMIEDVKYLIAYFVQLSKQAERPYPLTRVVITDTFEDEVNQVLLAHSGHEGYEAGRNGVHAMGKTMWVPISSDRIGFCVILDARLFCQYGLRHPLSLGPFMHEMMHVVFNTGHLLRNGVNAFKNPPFTKESLVQRSATSLIDEFDVDCWVDDLLVAEGFLARFGFDHCSDMTLHNIYESVEVDWPAHAVECLSNMPVAVEGKVSAYMEGESSIEELLDSVYGIVKDVLTVLSHTAAIYREDVNWPAVEQPISETSGSRRFLKEHLHTLLAGLRDTDQKLESRIEAITPAIDAILVNCGLTLETQGEGIYVGVKTPAR